MFNKKILQTLLLAGLLVQFTQTQDRLNYIRDFFNHSNTSSYIMGLGGIGIIYLCIERLLTRFAVYHAEKAGINAGLFEKNKWQGTGLGSYLNGINQFEFLFSVGENKEKILKSTGGWIAYKYLIFKTESALYNQSNFGKAQKGMSSKLAANIQNPLLSIKTIQDCCESNNDMHGVSDFRIDMLLYRSVNNATYRQDLITNRLKALDSLEKDSFRLKNEVMQTLEIWKKCNEIKPLTNK